MVRRVVSFICSSSTEEKFMYYVVRMFAAFLLCVTTLPSSLSADVVALQAEFGEAAALPALERLGNASGSL